MSLLKLLLALSVASSSHASSCDAIREAYQSSHCCPSDGQGNLTRAALVTLVTSTADDVLRSDPCTPTFDEELFLLPFISADTAEFGDVGYATIQDQHITSLLSAYYDIDVFTNPDFTLGATWTAMGPETNVTTSFGTFKVRWHRVEGAPADIYTKHSMGGVGTTNSITFLFVIDDACHVRLDGSGFQTSPNVFHFLGPTLLGASCSNDVRSWLTSSSLGVKVELVAGLNAQRMSLHRVVDASPCLPMPLRTAALIFDASVSSFE